MNQIASDFLWLGHAGEARDFPHLFEAGVQAVVELAAEEVPSQGPRELIHCRFPLLDGVGNDNDLLLLAIGTVSALLAKRVPTLVCCSSGLSRSPAVAAAALAWAYGETPESALKRVTAHHPSDVSPGLWNEITALLRATRSGDGRSARQGPSCPARP